MCSAQLCLCHMSLSFSLWIMQSLLGLIPILGGLLSVDCSDPTGIAIPALPTASSLSFLFLLVPVKREIHTAFLQVRGFTFGMLRASGDSGT